ncbi:MAG: ComEA family DNA-binding protein [Candidatus Gottesmanbacteria bacterium]
MEEFTAQTPPRFPSFFHDYRIPVIFLVASAVLVIAAVVVFVQTLRASEPIKFSQDAIKQNASESAELVVDVSGAVVHPGIYSMPVGSRIADVINRAGGTSSNIDQDVADKMINRASFVTDGMKIYFPKKENILSEQVKVLSATETIVSVNTSSSTQLDTLPGIGVVTAAKIIENRPYGSLEELVSKHVISASLLDKLRDQLSL